MKNEIKESVNKEKYTVLVWLDFGPYSYIHLGIISELNKLKNIDFVGIVTKQQDLSFFQKQKFIQFKKLFYYPECYIGKSGFNIENLKKNEEKFNLDLWSDIFTERSFYRYWTEFYKFTREEILTIIENSILFFNKILEEFKPQKILMQQAGENVSNLLLYKMAKKIGIETLMPINLHVKGKIHISNNLISKEISDEFEKVRSNFVGSVQLYNKEFIEKDSHIETLKTVSSFDSSIPTFSKKINHYMKRLSKNLEPTYTNVGKTKFNMIKHGISNHFETKKRGQFLDNNASKIIEENNFLYFPLQSEPEATVLVNSPFYSNQVIVIESIAKAIPIDSLLYVKEHPTQKDKFWRSISDYQKIIDIPNVRLIHPSVSSLKLLEKSQGVISISGSTGFEALFFQKPVILFGDEHYDKLSMVTKIKKMSNLSQEIKNALINFKFNENELGIFMDILNKYSLSIPYASIMKDGVTLSSIQRNGEDYNTTNLHFQKFAKKYEKGFKLIAKTVFSRLSETSQ